MKAPGREILFIDKYVTKLFHLKFEVILYPETLIDFKTGNTPDYFGNREDYQRNKGYYLGNKEDCRGNKEGYQGNK